MPIIVENRKSKEVPNDLPALFSPPQKTFRKETEENSRHKNNRKGVRKIL